MSVTAELTAPSILTESVITLTAGAASEVRRIMADNKIPEGYKLRVGVTGGGCSGLSYSLGFDKQLEGDDMFASEGIDILMDKRHQMYLSGIVVDFMDGLQGRGFTFNNPNATKTCGCGSSFSA
jgi:iron-sulfur cluster assembly protein